LAFILIVFKKKFRYPTYLFYDMVNNWNLDPIVEITTSEGGECKSE